MRQPPNNGIQPTPQSGAADAERYSVFKNSISPLSSRQRFFGFFSSTSQLSNALAFISKSTSAYRLVVVTDGRKLARDARLLSAEAADFGGSKIQALVENVAAIWKRTIATRSM